MPIKKSQKIINNIQDQLNFINSKFDSLLYEKKNDEYVNFLISQLNEFKQENCKIDCQINCMDKRYEGLMNQITFLHEIINNKLGSTNNNNLCINDINKIHYIYVDINIKIIFITMVGGGGAGGIGTINNFYYYSGGGGGSGSFVLRFPVFVQHGLIIEIKIGKGGINDPNIFRHGEDSYLKIITKKHVDYEKIKKNAILISQFYKNKNESLLSCCEKNNLCRVYDENFMIKVCGGKNGFPHFDDIIKNKILSVKGGHGGYDCDCSKYCKTHFSFDGSDGCDGHISVPSTMCAIGGDGASSALFKGGKGGGSNFYYGGNGGFITNEKIQIEGEDGLHGSGGGGSAPYSYPKTKKLSGNGGNGFLLMEF